MSQKPSLPKGTRDFGPETMAKRLYILDNIKSTFQKYGFMPIETPAMENLSTLTGKYGDEGDQLLFKILNSGDFLNKADKPLTEDSKALLPQIAEKGLKYDLTVPFARYVVMNQHTISYPFKRYQIQPVWRADRPQKGRYREFYQCDADVVGTASLVCEAEIIGMMTETFDTLGITDYTIKINNRKVLTGIVEEIGAPGKENDFCVAIDKLDKIGQEKVLEELVSRGLPQQSVDQVIPLLNITGSTKDKITMVKDFLDHSDTGKQGIKEVEEILNLAQKLSIPTEKVDFDVTLARGLSYYTGAIFEVQVNNVKIGSVSGGGRYDDLTGVFGLPNISGVGFSFGVDRIYDVMEALSLFPEENLITTQVLIIHFDEKSLHYGFNVLSQLRKENIKAEIYPEQSKIKKQFTYADKKNIPYTVIIGSEEVGSGKLTFRNMKSGSEKKLDISTIIDTLK